MQSVQQGFDALLAAQFFGKTEGRDKFAKGLQNYCRYRKHYAAGESKVMFKGLQESLGEFRSCIKFFKWIELYSKMVEIIRGTAQLRLIDYVELTSIANDIGYKAYDNVEYLCKVGQRISS